MQFGSGKVNCRITKKPTHSLKMAKNDKQSELVHYYTISFEFKLMLANLFISN